MKIKIHSLLILLFLLTSCLSTSENKTAEGFPQLNKIIKQNGSVVAGDFVYFIYDSSTYQQADKVEVRGSFNSWGDEQTGEWHLTKSSQKNIWFLKKTIEEVNVPSNSGQPEFKYVINDRSWLIPKKVKSGYKFKDAFIVLFDGDSPKEIAKKEKLAQIKLETIDDYKSTSDNKLQLVSNFRNVNSGNIAQNKLFRSYHPYKPSKVKYPVEKQRLNTALELIEKNKIKSIINLSGEEGKPKGYYKELLDQGNVLYEKSSYKTVYFKSDSDEFANTVLSPSGFHIKRLLISPLLPWISGRIKTLSNLVKSIKPPGRSSSALGLTSLSSLFRYSFALFITVKKKDFSGGLLLSKTENKISLKSSFNLFILLLIFLPFSMVYKTILP